MKRGFTLAEILITLVIIGIVAALTIPAVVKNYRDTQYKVQFKKVYSMLQTNFQKTLMVDFGGCASCYYPYENTMPQNEYATTNVQNTSGDCQNFWKNFMQNLKVSKYCENNALLQGCVPKYFDYAGDSSACWGFSETFINQENPAWILADGVILAGYTQQAKYPMVLVDINGFQKPNQLGVDVFTFYIKASENNVPSIKPADCFSRSGNRRKTSDMLKWVYK